MICAIKKEKKKEKGEWKEDKLLDVNAQSKVFCSATEKRNESLSSQQQGLGASSTTYTLSKLPYNTINEREREKWNQQVKKIHQKYSLK